MESSVAPVIDQSRSVSLPDITITSFEHIHIDWNANALTSADDAATSGDDTVTSISSYYLHPYRHSAHIDHIDAGIKRNHHYLSKRLRLYRKAFSDNTLDREDATTDGARIKLSTDSNQDIPSSSVFRDLNNNMIRCLMLADRTTLVETKIAKMKVASEAKIKNESNCECKTTDIETISVQQVTENIESLHIKEIVQP